MQLEVNYQTIEQQCTEKSEEVIHLTQRSQEIQQEFHLYEKEHRYANEEVFQREQHSQRLQNELTDFIREHRQLQLEHQTVREEMNDSLERVEQMKQSDLLQTECVSLLSGDEGKNETLVQLADAIHRSSADLQREARLAR